MSVEHCAFGSGGASGFEDIFWFGFARKKRINLHHRGARISFDWDQRGAGLFNPGRARDTEEMQDCIFDVAWVDSLAQFELFAAVFILSCVVTRDTPLPMVRSLVWGQRHEL